jgi:hypothetical protein
MDKRPITFNVIRDPGTLDVEYLKISDAETGEEVLRFLWDPNDAQTPENEKEFREWAERMLRSKDMI